jgi:hypothetical protein
VESSPTEVLAKEAEGLLQAQGRSDLGVSDAQVLKWRRDYDAVPVIGDRKGGRARTVQYAPEAPEVVAAIAVALDNDRNMDRAILDVFGRGISGIPEKAVKRSYRSHLSDAENGVRRAWTKRGLPRSDVPRSLRFPFKGSRKAGSSLVTDAVLAVLLGKSPAAGSRGLSLAIEELAPDIAPFYAEQEDRERLMQLASRLSLAGLRFMASHANMGRLTRSCADVRVLIDYSDALQRLLDLTGSNDDALPIEVGKILKLMQAMRPLVSGRSFGVGVAVQGLVLYSLIQTPGARRRLRASIDACEVWVPRFSAMSDIAESLPEHWRPALAPVTGGLHLAAFSEDDRNRLATHVTAWRTSHPEETAWLDENHQEEISVA